jgi:hypothetical protein
MIKRLLSIFALYAYCLAAQAQEFNCKVTLLHDKITGVDAQVFSGMQKNITEFMNTHKWTSDDYGTNEKIDVSLFINLTGNNVGGDVDAYSGSISIMASRPVYNSSYTSTLINYVDKDFIFHYSAFTPIRFDDNNVSGTDPVSANLTAVIAFYSYILLGLDYDSFAPDGGTPYFKKAQNIVSNAPEGHGITGWKAVENTKNRYWIADELLNTRFEDVRTYWYILHREGLDSMAMKPAESRTRILTNVKRLQIVNKENPSSILIQFFFNAKGDELLHILGQAPKADRGLYISMLSSLDVPNAAKYNALR